MTGVLMRLAHNDDHASSRALILAGLALASLYRHGLNTTTVKVQGAALRTLQVAAAAASQKGNLGLDTIKHVAAMMLLSMFEMHSGSQSSGRWTDYVLHSRRLLTNCLDDYQRPDTVSFEFVTVATWVYHHDITAQFSRRHWRLSGSIEPSPPEGTLSLDTIVQNMSDVSLYKQMTHP
jgi:hypothetical protein